MTDQPVRVRIAPSPTGDPHVGTAYMALFDLAFARQRGGGFVLRIEDTDRNRYVEDSEQRIYDSLRWLGLEWDEGPDKGGPVGPYRQSERLSIYQQYARQLVEAGHAYECWCSPERLETMRAEQRQRGEDPRYDRFCLGKTREQRAAEPGFSEPPVIRMLVPENPPVEFDDLIRGRTSAPFPDDQVLLKSDGFPTYHLAVVVDDHLMGITHVTRGEEWISSTPKQLLLYGWLGWEPPKWAHFPLLRNPDRSKISKRKNPAARLTWFREQGYLPEALLNFLALMGWSMPDGREVFSFADLTASFSWDRFSPAGSIFDVEKLDWLDGEYIRALSDDEFLRRARPFLPADADEVALRYLAGPLKARTKRLAEVPGQIDFISVGKLEPDATLLAKQGLGLASGDALRVGAELARATEPFEPAALQATFAAEVERRGWKQRAFYMTVRVALTGRTVTPPLFETMAALGRERVIERLMGAADGGHMPEVLVYVNGAYVPWDEATVPVEDRAMQFGDSVYEVIRYYHGVAFRLTEHFDRMARSAAGIYLPPPPLDEIKKAMDGLVQRQGLREASVYVQFSRGAGPRSHSVPTDLKPTLIAIARPAPIVRPRLPMTAITVSDDRWARCYLKTTMLLPNTLAKEQARRRGADDAIFVRDGFVMEASASNVFLVVGGRLVTSPLTNYILAGITRAVVLELAAQEGIPYSEEPVPADRLYAADEVMLSGTLSEITPIVAVDGHTVGDGQPGPVFWKLAQAFDRLIGV